MPAPEKYPCDASHLLNPSPDEDHQFNVLTLVLLSFFVGVFWGGLGMTFWYIFHP